MLPPTSGRQILNAKQSAERAGCSLPAWWKGVSNGRFPQPVYPAARAPRWYGDEIDAALERTRMKPSEAMAVRRDAKIKADREQAAA